MSSKDSFVPASNPSAMSMAAAGLNAHKNYGVKYMCATCASEVVLGKSDPVRCKECGHRVLYKKRTERMVQFEAR
ncbi:DNA-directed RNA polymerases I, II, and III subunit RPABC4 [Trichomonascus vanleenenianus]|uniref:DNA-directed RNA polymerase core subunit RPC10 n=1 Tax=Trichomonascus vanleenenianus TaxID=2268995 RepID=UPI003ECA61D2